MSKTFGIDIGGSKIRSVLWSGKRILKSREVRTPKSLKGFTKVLKGIMKNRKHISIGIAGVVKNTIVVSATNIKYLKNFNFYSLSPASGGIKLKMDNDARCFARAEYKLGLGKEVKSVLFITLGTGVGRAYVKNGKVLNIRRFEYAEDWEKDYQKIKNKNKLAEFLSEKLNLLVDALNPEMVVLGGGMVEKKGYFDAIKKMLEARFLTLGIRRAKLGKFAGAIGAAMLWTIEG